MIVSLNWAKQYLDLEDYSIEEIDKMISLHVIEIESLKKMVEATNLTIGHVLTCVPHPDSDHLHVCTVDLGAEVEQIVCGAPNVCAGQKVIVSKVGAVLPGDFKIKKGKIRGVESNGMICSLQELGFEDKYIPEQFKHGIYVLDDCAKPGDDPLKYLGLDDYLIELGLTPNRGDLLSVLGFVYDLGAVVKQKVKYQQPIVKEIDVPNPVSVSVMTDSCLAYNARYIKNVVIKESPWWLKQRLIASGIRPINNVVDITNYVLMELGQPLHSFDAKKLGNRIVVRNANPGEELVTLDEVTRVLNEDDVVITDGEKPVCLGGVMGGLNTCVDDTTTDIILEAAYFDPKAIRKTSSRLNLKSDSSMRFERKVDPNRVLLALNRATELLVSLADGEVLAGVSSVDKLDKNDKEVNTCATKVNNYLGTSLTVDEIVDILDSLAFKTNVDGDNIQIFVPSRRVDVENEQDIMEEIARIYGYDNIPSTIPQTNDRGYLTPKQEYLRGIRKVLEGLGLKETVTYTLINGRDKDLFTKGYGEYIKLAMPLSEEREYVRQSNLNGLMEVVSYNSSRKLTNLSLYEVGRVYSEDREVTLVSGALTGYHSQSLWQGRKEKVDFYLVKGMLECLAQKLGVELEFLPTTDCPEGFHPKKTADVYYNGEKIGLLGAIHPKLAQKNDVDEVYMFELAVDSIINRGDVVNRFVSIPKYPNVSRDIALVCDKSVTAKQITDLIKQTGKKLLTDVTVFDVYEGANIGEGKKSIAISLTFQDPEKTLETADVDKKVNSIVVRLERELNCTLRG